MSITIQKNIDSRKETDRVMWFSMWLLLSATTFGIAWFLMIYLLIKRRNAHFSRQEQLENLVLRKLGQLNQEKQQQFNYSSDFAKKDNRLPCRDAYAWTLSTILIFPAIYVFYFLSRDLQRHEEHEHAFLVETVSIAEDLGFEMNLDDFMVTHKIAFNKYFVLSIVTFGFAAVYWLYRIFNDYNRHFKRQWNFEDTLLKLFAS
jgi:hypothetical protein